MNKKIKTRFAPSPTGYLHVGGLRTALYSYLFAKKNNGIFLLRIEDTDRQRHVEGAAESLMETLKFFGLNWDEGPFFQSQRTEIYRAHAQKLLDSGKAYRCFCTQERLEEMREEQQKNKLSPKYDRKCLNMTQAETENLLAVGKLHVIRQLIPHETLEFEDGVRGKVSFHGKDTDDQVLIKSDGYPTYHLANVVDDHEMEITHVIRGEEWLPSTPKHIWLYRDFGWEHPKFAHLPLLLNADKSKLSKRQGDVAAEDYIKKGYLKEAVINFIALLGWNPGTSEEIFSIEDLIEHFDIERVQKAGAVFGLEKLDWLNGQYIRSLSLEDLTERLKERLIKEDWFRQSDFINLTSPDWDQKPEKKDFMRYLHSVQTRMKTLNDGPEMLKPFLLNELAYKKTLFLNEKMKVEKSTAILALEQSLKDLEIHEDYESEESLKTTLSRTIQRLGLKNGQVLWPLRVALSNEEYSPGAFELLQVLGKEKSLKRIQAALESLMT